MPALIENMTPAQKKFIAKKSALKETARAEAEQFINLSDFHQGIASIIAKTEVELFGYYACKVNGVKTFVEG